MGIEKSSQSPSRSRHSTLVSARGKASKELFTSSRSNTLWSACRWRNCGGRASGRGLFMWYRTPVANYHTHASKSIAWNLFRGTHGYPSIGIQQPVDVSTNTTLHEPVERKSGGGGPLWKFRGPCYLTLKTVFVTTAPDVLVPIFPSTSSSIHSHLDREYNNHPSNSQRPSNRVSSSLLSQTRHPPSQYLTANADTVQTTFRASRYILFMAKDLPFDRPATPKCRDYILEPSRKHLSTRLCPSSVFRQTR